MSRFSALPRRKHTRPPLRVSKSFDAVSLDGPRQKQVPPKAPKAFPLPSASQQVPTRIPDDVNVAKRTKQRRDKRPVKTIQFQSQSFADTGDNSKQFFEASTLGGSRQKQVPPKAANTLPLPIGSQEVLTWRESIRKFSPSRILDNGDIAQGTKKRHDKPPVETVQFERYSFADTADNAKSAKEATVFISSYLQSEIIYAACKIVEDDAESGTCRPPTSAPRSEAGVQKKIIYAHCKMVEDDTESPFFASTSNSASSGWRSEPFIRKGESAYAA